MDNFIQNQEFENEKSGTVKEGDNVTAFPTEAPVKKIGFAFWEVGTNSYKLKLTTAAKMELESKYRKNLISMMGDDDNIPPLTTMLQITHAAMKDWQHGLKLKDVINIYDEYEKRGGNMLRFYAEVYLQVFMVSGFFSESVTEDVAEAMQKVKDNI
ncbi:MAG: DUF6096 family protein [Lachnospiraceae bacterium]|nr:DUF6096 family protein [Lachnospiraceae bacterium]